MLHSANKNMRIFNKALSNFYHLFLFLWNKCAKLKEVFFISGNYIYIYVYTTTTSVFWIAYAIGSSV